MNTTIDRLTAEGARMLEAFPVLPLIGNQPLAVGAPSYAGTLDIGITADRDAFPDIDILAASVRDELHTLGVSTHVTVGVGTASLGSVRRVRS
jgi:hypothetical protein